jgi:hypothetical protein
MPGAPGSTSFVSAWPCACTRPSNNPFHIPGSLSPSEKKEEEKNIWLAGAGLVCTAGMDCCITGWDPRESGARGVQPTLRINCRGTDGKWVDVLNMISAGRSEGPQLITGAFNITLKCGNLFTPRKLTQHVHGLHASAVPQFKRKLWKLTGIWLSCLASTAPQLPLELLLYENVCVSGRVQSTAEAHIQQEETIAELV